MTRRLHLEEMRRRARRVLDYTAGLAYPDFVADPRTRDAVRFNLAAFGVAAGKLTKDDRADLGDALPWREADALPGVLLHLHFGAQDEIVWDLASNTLPGWLARVEGLIDDA